MDSSGLAVLIAKHKALGGRFPIITPKDSFFRKLFAIAGVDSLFTLFETLDDAVANSGELA